MELQIENYFLRDSRCSENIYNKRNRWTLWNLFQTKEIGSKVIFNSLGQVTSLLLGSPPPISLQTGAFCSISSADDGIVIRIFIKS